MREQSYAHIDDDSSVHVSTVLGNITCFFQTGRHFLKIKSADSRRQMFQSKLQNQRQFNSFTMASVSGSAWETRLCNPESLATRPLSNEMACDISPPNFEAIRIGLHSQIVYHEMCCFVMSTWKKWRCSWLVFRRCSTIVEITWVVDCWRCSRCRQVYWWFEVTAVIVVEFDTAISCLPRGGLQYAPALHSSSEVH